MTVTDSIRDVLFIYGLAIVVSLGAAALIRLMVGMLSLGSVFDEWRAKRQSHRELPTAATPTKDDDAIPAHHVAAIAAAVYVMGASRVVHIQPATAQAQWSAGGRAAHHSSHQVILHH